MKSLFRAIFVITFLTSINFYSTANAANIGVLDVEEVVKNSSAMSYIQKKLLKKQKMFQKEIDKKQSELESEGKKLSSKEDILSKKAFKKEEDKFEKKVLALRKDLDKKQNTLKKASLKAMSKINDKINDILIEVSKERDLDIVIPTSETLYYKDALDISPEVSTKLNKSLKKVDIKFD